MVYYGNERQLEYDFVVAPGGRHTDITLAFDGAKSLSLDAKGNLLVGAGAGSLVQRSPVIYQEKDGQRRAIRGGYVIRKDGLVGFRAWRAPAIARSMAPSRSRRPTGFVSTSTAPPFMALTARGRRRSR